jgi:hypothetical protein
LKVDVLDFFCEEGFGSWSKIDRAGDLSVKVTWSPPPSGSFIYNPSMHVVVEQQHQATSLPTPQEQNFKNTTQIQAARWQVSEAFLPY